jgi:hypothetical protein
LPLREDKIFQAPEDKNQHLWRYTDFAKFVSLLSTKSLWFSRSDLLGDPFEGSMPKGNQDARDNGIRKIYEESLKGKVNMTRDEYVKFCSREPIFRRQAYINCWHRNDHESMAMWKIYGKMDNSIAIRSSYNRISCALGDNPVSGGCVKYSDFDLEKIKNNGNYLYYFINKMKPFEFEDEFRLFTWHFDLEGVKNEDGCIDIELYRVGKQIEVDVEQLIESIYVSPQSPEWFLNSVKSVIRAFRFDVPVFHSRLSSDPRF